jgi:hypothetical protein
MAVHGGPKIATSGLVLSLDAVNYKSFKGEATTNLIPSPTLNAYPTTGNGWGTYNTNQYGSGTYFSIGSVASVSSNIVTMTSAHSLRTYDVMRPQTTGGGVTADTDYFIKKVSDTSFTLHAYNGSQDGSQGYISSSTGTHKVYDSIANDTRISVNSTNFPTMWWGAPHLPNSGLVKELRYGEFNAIPNLPANDCIRLHYIRTDNVKDGMSYGVDCTVTPSSPVTVSFYTRAANANAVGKVVQYYTYNYSGGSATAYAFNFTLGQVGVWERQTFTFTPAYGTMISYWFPQSSGTYVWDWSCMQVEQKSYATAFVAGTRGTTVATGGGWADLTGNENNGELVNGPSYSSANGGSIVFDGSNDSIIIPENSALNTQTPTVEVWVKTNATTQYGFWFEKGQVNTQYSLFQEAGYIVWRQNIGGSITNLIINPTSSYMNTSSWYQVVGTYTSGTRIVYINGVLVGSDAQTGTIATNTNGMSIGAYGGFNGSRGYYYNGNIASVKIYNRALSTDEVLQNFNATRGRYGV